MQDNVYNSGEVDMGTLLWILKEVFGFDFNLNSMGKLIQKALSVYNKMKSGQTMTNEEVEEFNKLKLRARAMLRLQAEEDDGK